MEGSQAVGRGASARERGPECEESRMRRESKKDGRLHSAEHPEAGGPRAACHQQLCEQLSRAWF